MKNATRRALLARLKTADRRVFRLLLDFNAALKEVGIDVNASGFDGERHPDPLVRASYWLRDAAITLDQAVNLPPHTHLTDGTFVGIVGQ